jgi:hypothetical protein
MADSCEFVVLVAASTVTLRASAPRQAVNIGQPGARANSPTTAEY